MGAPGTQPQGPPPSENGANAETSAGPPPAQAFNSAYPAPQQDPEAARTAAPPPVTGWAPPPGAPPSAAAPPSTAGYAPPHSAAGYAPPAGVPPAAGFRPPPGTPMIPLYPMPVAGIPIRPPRVQPQPGQVLLGYEVYQPAPGCCQCEGLSASGIIAVVLLVLLFWPLAWIPCVMPECYEQLQCPVYGWPPPAPPGYQGAPPQGAPAAGYPPS